MWPSRSGRSAMMPAENRRDGALRRLPVDDRVGPLAIDVDVVAGRVEVPRANARRPAADLGELEALRPDEPLHVGRRRPDAERVDRPSGPSPSPRRSPAAVDAVGGDELRRDPPRAHRLEHVRVVVRHEVVHDLAADADRVVEGLVALDELLDRDRSAPCSTPRSSDAPPRARRRRRPASCPTRRRRRAA